MQIPYFPIQNFTYRNFNLCVLCAEIEASTDGKLAARAAFTFSLGCLLLLFVSCAGEHNAGDKIGENFSTIAVTVQFDGDNGNGGFPVYKDHPDMAIGANGTQVVETSGQNINIYNYSGALLSSTPIRSFIARAIGSVGTINDPRIVYDPFIARWLFVCSCSANYLIVSATSDANSSWKGAPLSLDSGDLLMAVGFDKNGVYVSETDSTGLGKLFALPNADVAWSGAGTLSVAHEAIASGPGFQMPAIDLTDGKALTDPEYFVSHSPTGPKGANVPLALIVTSVNWLGLPSNPIASFSSTAIATSFLYNTPINAQQPAIAPDIRGTESHRVFGVYSYGGDHLYSVVASGPCESTCGSQGRDLHNLFFFFDVNIPGLTLNQESKISDTKRDFLFPSLAVDSQGNLAMAATGVSNVESPSIYEWHRLASDSTGAIQGPNLLTSGTQSYSCIGNPVGWGTYSTTTRDPADGTQMWTVQEYGNSATPCNWSTRLVEFQILGNP